MRLVGYMVGLFVLSGLAAPAHSQEIPVHPFFTGPVYTAPARLADLQHLDLTLDLRALATRADTAQARGRATFRLVARQDSLSGVPVWTGGLRVDSAFATVDGVQRAVRWDTLEARRLQVHLTPPAVPDSLRPDTSAGRPLPPRPMADASFELTLYFRLPPGCGLHVTPPTAASPALWTEPWALGHPTWHPVLDLPLRPSTSTLTLTLPSDWVAAGPGTLVRDGQAQEGADRVAYFEQRVPTPQRVLATTAGAWAVQDTSISLGPAQRVPVRFLAAPDRLAALVQTAQPALDALRYLSSQLEVPYPWPQLTLASLPGPSSDVTAHAGLLLLRDDLLQPTGAAPDTALAFSLAQAMAQQWVGQAIQASTPTDRWLHDGPATYLAALFEADGEADRLAMRMRQLKAAYLTEAVRYRRPLVWDQWTDAAALRDAHSTAKGAWVLHQLREQLTPLAWTRAVNAFVRRHTFSTTDSEGLRAALEEATGIAQGPYFDAWVYAAGHPMLAASYTYEARQAQLQLRVDQEQGGYLVPEAFTLPLSATVRTLAGTERLDIPVTVSTQTTEANVAMRPRYVQLDPDLGWLVEIRMEQDAPGWVAQARFGEGLVARVDAVEALADFSNDPALLLGLRSILQEAPPAPIRAALAELLGQVPPSAVAEGLLRPLLDDPSPLVRQEALRSSMAYPDRPGFRATAYRLAQTDPVPTVQGAAVVALTRLDSVSALDVVRSALITPSPQDVIRRSAFEAMSALDVPPDDAARLVAPFLAPTAPRTTRLAALHYLHTVGLATDDLRALATPLLADADPALRHAAAQTPIPLTDERWEAALGQQLAAEPCLSIQATLRRALSSSQDVPK